MSSRTPTTGPALRPSQLNALARDLLEGGFPSIWVEGELSSLTRPASGHLYFALKDERAQVRCAMFKMKAQYLRFLPREGLQVLVRGKLTLYEPRGDYQLVLDHMEEAGEGALRRAFEALKARLEAEGLFAESRKRPLPRFVRRLGVLTSPSGAVIRDIQSVLARRWPLLDVELLPVPVQGATAAPAIIQTLRAAYAAGRHDVLLVARGGGSLEDLWCFNDEALVRTIAESPVPVVSAVGHEVDFTLCDFVADLRAPTPSAGAELLVPDRVELRARIDHLQARLQRRLAQLLDRARQRADHAGLRLQAERPQRRIERGRDRADALTSRMAAAMARRIAGQRGAVEALARRLDQQAPALRLQRLRQRLALLGARQDTALRRGLQARTGLLRELGRGLHAISPLATLGRGYAILQRADGRAVRTADDVAAGEVLRALVAKGELRLRVERGE
ncbi:MAG TPA: exodeoxyribonuclease VII large subunit [Xanthomonadaceae bacterium]|nr:exodeoxyribonuclease VII large subunit [Xanthomonadaceae bacterium]